MKPVLIVPGPMLLKLRYDEPLSNFALSFDVRRYIQYGYLVMFAPVVGRCRLTLSNPS